VTVGGFGASTDWMLCDTVEVFADDVILNGISTFVLKSLALG